MDFCKTLLKAFRFINMLTHRYTCHSFQNNIPISAYPARLQRFTRIWVNSMAMPKEVELL